MRMVRWMCGIKLQRRLPSKGLRERLGLNDIISIIQQNRLRWYGPVLRKDNDWVKKCMEYEMEGARPRGRPKKTWRLWKKTVRHVNWTRRMPWIVKDGWNMRNDWWSWWVWEGECFFWYRLTQVVPDKVQRAVK